MEFGVLLKRLMPKLKGIAYKLNTRHTYFNNDDLYQEEIVHLWSEFQKGSLSDKTDSYILQGCYYHLKNYIRMAVDNQVVISLDAPKNNENQDIKESLSLAAAPVEEYYDSLHAKLLAEAIYNNGLTAKEKQLLPLFAEGLTVREIGHRLGVSHVMVLKMKAQIREKCLKHLDQ